MTTETKGPVIRTLTDAEKKIRDRYAAQLASREETVRVALRAVQEAKQVLNDIVLSFNGGNPCVLKQDTLHEVAPDA